jgi:hypothetical protein
LKICQIDTHEAAARARAPGGPIHPLAALHGTPHTPRATHPHTRRACTNARTSRRRLAPESHRGSRSSDTREAAHNSHRSRACGFRWLVASAHGAYPARGLVSCARARARSARLNTSMHTDHGAREARRERGPMARKSRSAGSARREARTRDASVDSRRVAWAMEWGRGAITR